jgi:ribosomal protein L7/L12
MMMRDDTLVTETAMKATADRLARHGADELVKNLMQTEAPQLGPFVRQYGDAVAGRLVLSGAPRPLVMEVHRELLVACTLVYLAVRQGTYEIWEGTALGGHLSELMSGLDAAPSQAAPPALPPCSVVLLEAPTGTRTALVTVLRRATGQTAHAARQILRQVPLVVAENIPSEAAEQLRQELEDAGGRATVVAVPDAQTQEP